MSGIWEERLRQLATGGQSWDFPISPELIDKLEVLKRVLDRVAGETGLAGVSGPKASESLQKTSIAVAEQITYITGAMSTGIDDANEVRRKAQERLFALPAGELSDGQEALVRGAAIGSTIIFGPLSVFAGEGAVGLVNNGLAARREDAARQAYLDISSDMDAVEVAPPPRADTGQSFDQDEDDSTTGGSGNGGGGGGGGGGRSRTPIAEAYPDFDVSPLDDLPPGLTYTPPNENGGSSELPDLHGDTPIIDLEPNGPQPTPDGPLGGINTMPGHGNGLVGTLPPGSGIIGAPGGPAAGLGSGLSAGLVAGAGGAAALRRLGAAPAGAGAVPNARGVAGTGGLLGKGGSGGAAANGSGLGVRGGVGGAGGMAGGGVGAGTQGTAARGAGMRAGAGGMTGPGAGGSVQQGTGSSRSATGAGGRGASGAGGRGAGGMGAGAGGRGVAGMGPGSGSRSDRKDQGRGLGGPIAPRMEDDEQIGPRSENAEAGGRDD